jgi:GGDEF domain-containing protein
MDISIPDKVAADYKKILEQQGKQAVELNTAVTQLLLRELRRMIAPGYEKDPFTGARTRFSLGAFIEANVHGDKYPAGSFYEEKFLCVDIHQFRKFIEKHGAEEGQRFLRELSGTLIAAYGAERVFRYGGDDFIVVLGQDAVCSFPKHEDVKVKYSTVNIKAPRNQAHYQRTIGEITYLLDKGLVMADPSGGVVDV